MTVGELRRRLAELDGDELELEIIVEYEDDDGDTAERSYYHVAGVERRLDPDTASEYVRVECADD